MLKRIGAPPFNPALAVDALEIPNEVHPKIPAGRNRGAPLVGIKGLAQLLREGVEAGFPENLLETIVKKRDHGTEGSHPRPDTSSPAAHPDDQVPSIHLHPTQGWILGHLAEFSTRCYDVVAYSQHIRETVRRWTSIPVAIGLGPIKTLAKVANKLSKKNSDLDGVLDFGA